MSITDVLWMFFLLGLCLASTRFSRLYFGHWFTPPSIYVCANLGSLALYHLRILELQTLSASVYGMALGSSALFVGGSLAASGWRARWRDLAWDCRPDIRNLNGFFYLAAVVANVGWVVAAAILVLQFGIGGLISNLWLLQDEFQMQFIGYLNLLGILVAPAYILKRTLAPTGRRRLLDVLLVVGALLGLVLAGIKSYLAFTGVAAGLAWSVARPQGFKARHFTAVLVLLMGFFIFYNQQIDVFVYKEYQGAGIFGELPWLHRPYLYLVGSWPALENLLHGEVAPPPRFGHVVLEPMWKLLSGLGLAQQIPKPLPFTNIGPEMFNVYSFVGEVYWDVGLWAALAGSWLLGVVSTRLYIRARTCGYWGHRLVYAIFGYGIFISLFQYGYRFNSVFLLLFTYLVGFFVMRNGVFVSRRSDP